MQRTIRLVTALVLTFFLFPLSFIANAEEKKPEARLIFLSNKLDLARLYVAELKMAKKSGGFTILHFANWKRAQHCAVTMSNGDDIHFQCDGRAKKANAITVPIGSLAMLLAEDSSIWWVLADDQK